MREEVEEERRSLREEVERERAELEQERVARVVERFRMTDELQRAAQADRERGKAEEVMMGMRVTEEALLDVCVKRDWQSIEMFRSWKRRCSLRTGTSRRQRSMRLGWSGVSARSRKRKSSWSGDSSSLRCRWLTKSVAG